ncbi:MAG: SpoIIE family protein phosphatase [Kofleriaceae bacterium]
MSLGIDEPLTEEQLMADLAALAVLADAEAFLTELVAAMFPNGAPTLEAVTWGEPRGSFHDGGAPDPVADAETRLREAEARFRTLVEQIPAVTFMAVLGEGKNEVYVSPHIEQMLGYSQREWLEDPFLWYWRLHPADRPMWNDEFARGCRTGGPFRAECRFLARDGREVWVHGEARVVRDALGRPMFLQGVAFDITDAKRAQSILLDEAVKKAKVEEELAIAKRVQTSILPRSFALPGYEVDARMVPADDIGGDYYDLFVTPDAGWLAIGDVSGHGLDAGLVMMMVQSAMAAIVRMQPLGSPRDMIEALNDVLYENIRKRLRQRDHVTFTLFRVGLDGHVVFAGAHEDIIVVRATGHVETIRTPGVWLGAKRGIANVTIDTTLTLEDGDLMVLYTDGITEARDCRGTQLELERLCAMVNAVAACTPGEICDHVIAQTKAWAVKQDDDMSIVVVRRKRR